MPLVKCPTCGKETEYDKRNEFRPFCSKRCQLIDFGAWADEEFALPDRSSSLTEADLEMIERAASEREKEDE